MKDFGGFVLSCLLLIGLLTGAIAWVVNTTTIAGDAAKIEQLRSDVAKLDPSSPSAANVLAQATNWNQTIRSWQSYNRTWYAGWAIPDEWDQIQLIAIP